MKKNFSVIFIFLAFICVINSFVKIKTISFAKEVDCDIVTSSKSAYLSDSSTKNVVYSSNELKHYPIASMCKIMTLLLCFEEIDVGNIKFDEYITVSDNASSMGGSQVFLETNGQYKVFDLIKSITVASANDACVAMAEKICGSESAFVKKMNQKAKELGMDNTVFVNCTGLPKPGQYSCAKDVANMFSKLITHKDYYKFSTIWMDEIRHPKDRITQISNTNKLVKFYEGCDGGKTGYTSEAGHCLCATAYRNGTRLICVVINAPDSKTRFKEVSSMFNYGFANYTSKLLIDNNKPLEIQVEVKGGKKQTLSVVSEKPIYIFLKNNEKRSFDFDFKPVEKVKAPISKGEKVGYFIVYENGVEIDNVAILSNEDIDCASYFDSLKSVINNWAII